MGCPAPNMGSQEKKNIVGDEGLGLDQGKELFEADEEGVLMLNMEKLNMLTNNGLNNIMLPVSSSYMDYKEDPVDLEDTGSYKLLKEESKIETHLVLNDKLDGIYDYSLYLYLFCL